MIVQTTNLTRRFGNFIAVNDVSFNTEAGEIFGFLGANGAGKTTLIRMLCGLLKPSSGQATVAGYDVFTHSEQVKRSIGYMSQKFSLYPDLSVKDNLLFWGGVYSLNKAAILQRSAELFNLVGLTGHENDSTADLPLGFKQRLALVCAILHNPPVIFLDEPTSGIDPKARRNFWDIIRHMAQSGKTVFVTTHFMDEAEYCHRAMIMRDGVVMALDTPTALRAKWGKTMQEVFMNVVGGYHV